MLISFKLFNKSKKLRNDNQRINNDIKQYWDNMENDSAKSNVNRKLFTQY
jgi:hypothetical protein